MEPHHQSLRRLAAVHRFPGPFLFKVIGSNSAGLVAGVVQVAVWRLGPQAWPEVSIRRSHGGRHQAISLRAWVPHPEAVVDIYRGLRALPSVRYLL